MVAGLPLGRFAEDMTLEFLSSMELGLCELEVASGIIKEAYIINYTRHTSYE